MFPHMHSQLTPKVILTPLRIIFRRPLLQVPPAAVYTLLTGHSLHTGTPQEVASAHTKNAGSPARKVLSRYTRWTVIYYIRQDGTPASASQIGMLTPV